MILWKWLVTACALMFALAAPSVSYSPPPWVLNQGGFYQLEAGQPDWAVALFEMNAQLYPDDCNLADSLAHAYEATGQSDLARQQYQRALMLGEAHADCHWCANARAGLERLN